MIKNPFNYESPQMKLVEIQTEGICTGSDGVPGFSGDNLIDDSENYG